ncbi:hypothetical protein [Streptomyces sp. LaPpAH-108]|uniref:hypothetical protein n=1 Tax=Streptomyces sp. LaPpAH-108 TaxID=1155714 RepID=UPI0003683C1D|nr:hypothetical protein [Streptomyces sp. LaPpAH-108]
MGTQLHIQVPEDLWQLLDAADFDSLDSFRGADQWADVAHAVVATAEQGLGMGANLVTVLLARDAIASFVEQVRRWTDRRGAETRRTGEAVVNLTVRTADDTTTISITRKGTADVDVELLTRLLASAMNSRQGQDG